MNKTTLFFLALLIPIASQAQTSDRGKLFLPDRSPVFVGIGLAQKWFTPASLDFNEAGVDIKVEQAHAIGLRTSLEFVLRDRGNYNGLWTLSPGLSITSYSLKYEGVFSADFFGFDQDAITRDRHIIAAFELGMESRYYREMGKSAVGFVSAGLNVVHLQRRGVFINSVGRVVQDGQTTFMTLISNNNDFFGGLPNLNQKLNPVIGLGLMNQLATGHLVGAQLRFCSSNDFNTKEDLTSELGLQGLMMFKKSFVALDISYQFGINQRKAITWN